MSAPCTLRKVSYGHSKDVAPRREADDPKLSLPIGVREWRIDGGFLNGLIAVKEPRFLAVDPNRNIFKGHPGRFSHDEPMNDAAAFQQEVNRLGWIAPHQTMGFEPPPGPARVIPRCIQLCHFNSQPLRPTVGEAHAKDGVLRNYCRTHRHDGPP
jgi:hypothetical protein